MKRKNGKKLIAPSIVAGVLVLYYLFFAGLCIWLPGMALVLKLIFGILPLALAGVCIAMLVERIKEVRSGVEDDLGQY